VHSPKVLVVIGVLAFSASLGWMYLENRARLPDTEPAVPSTTSQESGVEPRREIASASDSAPAVGEAQPNQRARAQTTRNSRPASNRNGDDSRTPAYQSPRAVPQEVEADVDTTDPAGQLSISGRVLGPGGAPVPGIKLTAHHRAADAGSRDNKAHETRSGATGNYEFSGLMQGDYYVRTADTANYPATGAHFRAGTRSADIVLRGSKTVQIVGRVTDTAGYALADVEVKPGGTDSVTVRTDATGNFRTQATGIRPGATASILFSLEGYQQERAYVNYGDINARGEVRLDMQLLGLEGTVKVSGVLRGADGKMVAGESVQLESPSLNNRYRETSQPDGSFVFPAVEPGGDYRLSIRPRSAYESYYQQSISIQPPSANLAVTLDPLETGRLTGRMIDSVGRTLGGYSMTLSSSKSQGNYVEVTGDDNGYFTVENAPAGNLTFSTRSKPQFSVSGITLEPGGSADVDLVLDWGDNEVSGRVRDDSRRPVPGASVQLSGQYSGRGVHSNSLRSTTTDSEGNFRFSELGSGMHTLTVRMNGFETATKAIDVGSYTSDVEVVLTSSSN
jgi:protocatechuate 3,4-dioxygenase beta subunit